MNIRITTVPAHPSQEHLRPEVVLAHRKKRGPPFCNGDPGHGGRLAYQFSRWQTKRRECHSAVWESWSASAILLSSQTSPMQSACAS